MRAYVCRWGRIAGLSTALQISYALVQATVGVGTVIIVYIGVAYTRGGGVGPFLMCVCMTIHACGTQIEAWDRRGLCKDTFTSVPLFPSFSLYHRHSQVHCP